MWDKLSTTEKIFSIIVVMGSVVDIFQFTWLIKKSYLSLRGRVEDRLRKEILLKLHHKNQNEEAPFMGFNEEKK